MLQPGTRPAAVTAPPAAAKDEQTDALLWCAGLSKSFGGVRALRDVRLHVPSGQVVSLIGPNGAGKTSLFNCVSGFVAPDAGEVWFDGTRIDGRPAHAVARAGLVRTFQSIRMFSGLTVAESVLVAQYARGGENPRLRTLRPIWKRSRSVAEVEEILELLDLGESRNKQCTDLPLLGQRKVELARAIACRPSLLLLDEPSAGATSGESRELAAVVRKLRDGGMTIFVIEHNVPFVMSVSDLVWVMNFGEIVAHGTPDEVRTNEIVREIYLG
jgi:ABC-type branched-subunit amino acid transport system ATPase component